MTQIEQTREVESSAGDPASARRDVAKILGFAFLILLLAIVTHSLVDSGLRRIRSSNFGVANRIFYGEINADILISGSSRAEVHYDPTIIAARTNSKAYNIGLNGSQTDMQVARLKTYLRHNKRPTLLIHNLDAFSFQNSHEQVYDPAQFVPYLSEPALYEALLHIDPNFWKAKWMPLYGYTVLDMSFRWIFGLAALAGWSPREDHIDGFRPRYDAWTDDFERFKLMHPKGKPFEIEGGGVYEMEQLLELCRDNGINVLLVYSPEYREMQALTTNRNEIFAEFQRLKKQYGAEFIDYSDSPISGVRSNFYNSQHLNADGAHLFSEDLAQRIASGPVFEKLAAANSGKPAP